MNATSRILPDQDRAQALAAAKILGAGLEEVVADLRLIDAADLVAYIRAGQFANLGDLVDSSAELFFKQGTLSFGWAAEAALRWDRPPRISLAMEFRHLAVTVFFELTLTARQGTVCVHRILFERAHGGAEGLRALSEAFGDARFPVPRKRPSTLKSTS